MRSSYSSAKHHAENSSIISDREIITSTTTAQDMMYVKRLLESINLRVDLPMILEVDNKGAVVLINN